MGTPALPTISCLPREFRDKQGRDERLVLVEPSLHGAVKAMYLAYQPRGSIQGLPPLRDEACVKWVEEMLRTAVNIVAVGTIVENRSAGPGDDARQVVGHVALFPIDSTRCEMLIVVSPAYQNAGIGTALTRSCVRAAAELGYQRIWLPVDAVNVRARRVYEKCGFQYLSHAPARELDMARDVVVSSRAVFWQADDKAEKNFSSGDSRRAPCIASATRQESDSSSCCT
jgi:ribosomal protein S18 acetylase RimI-like enzyme